MRLIGVQQTGDSFASRASRLNPPYGADGPQTTAPSGRVP